MRTHAAVAAVALFAVASAADEAGYIKRNGKKTAVAAV
jgi:hypothetical protein